MKKLVALLLSVSMIFALTACGSNGNTKDTADTQPSSESTEAVTDAPTEEPYTDEDLNYNDDSSRNWKLAGRYPVLVQCFRSGCSDLVRRIGTVMKGDD